jgi:hypothetical protein
LQDPQKFFGLKIYHLATLFSPENEDRSLGDVMITIFCDFRQFSAKNGVFSQTNVMIKFLHNIQALFLAKNAFSPPSFLAKIF